MLERTECLARAVAALEAGRLAEACWHINAASEADCLPRAVRFTALLIADGRHGEAEAALCRCHELLARERAAGGEIRLVPPASRN
jgi:hypothetical protein